MNTSPGGDPGIRVVIIGPEETGRRWFLLSFPRSLVKYQDSLDFEYHIEEIFDRINSRPTIPDIEKAEEMPDVLWRFSRLAKFPTYANTISSHTHTINVFSQDIDALDVIETGNTPTKHFLFILLDPTLLSDESDHHTLQNKKMTRTAYKEFIQNALDELSFSPGKDWYVAAIVTKGDLLDHDKQGWALIRQEFGENIEMLFKQNKIRFKDIKPFRTSAFGYFLEGGEIRANPDPLHYDQVWQPEVEAPFFWAFEVVEKQKLNSTDWITRLLFRNQRKLQYKSYKVISLVDENI